MGVKDFIIRNYSNENNSYLIVPIHASGLILIRFFYIFVFIHEFVLKFKLFLDDVYKIDWNVVSIDKFVETEPPTTEQKKTKFYEEYLTTSNVISPWYRNITPIQVMFLIVLCNSKACLSLFYFE